MTFGRVSNLNRLSKVSKKQSSFGGNLNNQPSTRINIENVSEDSDENLDRSNDEDDYSETSPSASK